jgi:hypothetical protein
MIIPFKIYDHDYNRRNEERRHSDLEQKVKTIHREVALHPEVTYHF